MNRVSLSTIGRSRQLGAAPNSIVTATTGAVLTMRDRGISPNRPCGGMKNIFSHERCPHTGANRGALGERLEGRLQVHESLGATSHLDLNYSVICSGPPSEQVPASKLLGNVDECHRRQIDTQEEHRPICGAEVVERRAKIQIQGVRYQIARERTNSRERAKGMSAAMVARHRKDRARHHSHVFVYIGRARLIVPRYLRQGQFKMIVVAAVACWPPTDQRWRGGSPRKCRDEERALFPQEHAGHFSRIDRPGTKGAKR